MFSETERSSLKQEQSALGTECKPIKTKIMKYKYSISLGIIIIILSLIPVPEVKQLDNVPLMDKWVHFLMYGALTVAMWIDWILLKRQNNIPTNINDGSTPIPSVIIYIVMTLVIPSFLGGMLEILQPLCNRSCEMLDFVADAIGAILGTIAGLVLSNIYKAHS